jgi:hypothetical protein
LNAQASTFTVPPLLTVRLVVLDAPKVAVPVGTLPVSQLVPVVYSADPGLASQVLGPGGPGGRQDEGERGSGEQNPAPPAQSADMELENPHPCLSRAPMLL